MVGEGPVPPAIVLYACINALFMFAESFPPVPHQNSVTAPGDPLCPQCTVTTQLHQNTPSQRILSFLALLEINQDCLQLETAELERNKGILNLSHRQEHSRQPN